MTSDCHSTCKISTIHSKSQQKETPQTQGVPVWSWEKLGVDLLEFNRVHCLLAVDYYRSIDSSRSITYSDCYSCYKASQTKSSQNMEFPKTLMSDDNSQFDCQEFSNFAKQLCFIHTLSLLTYPIKKLS